MLWNIKNKKKIEETILIKYLYFDTNENKEIIKIILSKEYK